MRTYDGADAIRVLQAVEALELQIRNAADAMEEERRLLPSVVHAKMYRPAGRLLLGLDPGDPFF